MLDIPRMDRIRLTGRPRGQRVIGYGILAPNYHLPPRVRIEVEGLDRLPSHPVVFAMNHTDRYNFWPFQYALWRRAGRFTATWVKGKYYENELIGRFMEAMNNIPTVSRGYIVARDFASTFGRRPTDAEYEAARRWVDATADPAGDASEHEAAARAALPAALLDSPRSILGRPFDPAREAWPEAVGAVFRHMMARFVELNGQTTDKGLDTIVFPQGTRSVRLTKGHIGLAQIALHFRRTIVPVGCSGSDRVYPGSSPFAKGGRIVYRVGAPLTFEDLTEFHIPEAFEPFTPEAESRHRARFQALVDLVMERIDGLVDEPYRFAPEGATARVKGADRFI